MQTDSHTNPDRRTVLYNQHLVAGARMVSFHGWNMPLHYGSQVQEHHAVRQQAGVFDVSHMTVIDLSGKDATPFLQWVLANDVAKLQQLSDKPSQESTPEQWSGGARFVGKALYSALLQENGGILDDLIVYKTAAGYRLIVNCGTREKDLEWLSFCASQPAATLIKSPAQAPWQVQITERTDVALLAVQGPLAISVLAETFGPDMRPFLEALPVFYGADFLSAARGSHEQENPAPWFIGRTGYTGEDGVELLIPADQASSVWQQLLAAGVAPCGLGARDTLRLEAGMNLYGGDMDETVSPLASNMEWTVAWQPVDRHFIGRAALEAEKEAGTHPVLKGFMLEGRAVLRGHQLVFCGETCVGEITSGSFSPTLNASIALARVQVSSTEKTGTPTQYSVEIRGKRHPVQNVSLPFVRKGKRVAKNETGS